MVIWKYLGVAETAVKQDNMDDPHKTRVFFLGLQTNPISVWTTFGFHYLTGDFWVDGKTCMWIWALAVGISSVLLAYL